MPTLSFYSHPFICIYNITSNSSHNVFWKSYDIFSVFLHPIFLFLRAHYLLAALAIISGQDSSHITSSPRGRNRGELALPSERQRPSPQRAIKTGEHVPLGRTGVPCCLVKLRGSPQLGVSIPAFGLELTICVFVVRCPARNKGNKENNRPTWQLSVPEV